MQTKKNVLSIEDRVKNAIETHNLIEKEDKILVAVSGGSDSMCLLVVLMNLRKELNFKIAVAHVHHMIRKESDEEEKKVIDFCNNNEIEVYTKKIDIPKLSKESKQSTETIARNERYKFFSEIAEKAKCNKIAVAHNLNDNAETVLMHFMRGTSLNGLSGIKYRNGNIIRPLLNITKDEINEYCQNHEIEYAVDKTNFELVYTRNKVRLDLIKKIEDEYNPNFLVNVSKMSDIISEEEEFLKEFSIQQLNKTILKRENNNIYIDLNKFMQNSKCIINRMIILLIQEITKRPDNIETIHINDIYKLLENKIKGKKYIIKYKYIVEIVDKNTFKISKYIENNNL